MGRIAITGGGKARLLRAKVPTLSSWLIFFFKNDFTPTDGSVLGDFSVEPNAKATAGGISGEILTPTWQPSFARPDGLGQMSSDNIDVAKRAAGPPLVLYGWYLVSDPPFFMMGARFPGVVPKVIEFPILTYTFRIDLLEDSLP